MVSLWEDSDWDYVSVDAGQRGMCSTIELSGCADLFYTVWCRHYPSMSIYKPLKVFGFVEIQTSFIRKTESSSECQAGGLQGWAPLVSPPESSGKLMWGKELKNQSWSIQRAHLDGFLISFFPPSRHIYSIKDTWQCVYMCVTGEGTGFTVESGGLSHTLWWKCLSQVLCVPITIQFYPHLCSTRIYRAVSL